MQVVVRYAVFVLLSLLPAAAFAQQAGIAGVVRDASGGVLPGVTVTIASPALIEKTQTSVTDGAGQYRFVNLRPGTYEVSFTLTGFSTVTRPGVELEGDFTAPVNADLRVGTVEETITVTGETPLVDVRNTIQQAVLSRDVIDAIPAGDSYFNLGVLIPGVRLQSGDVGGSGGDTYVPMTIHGSRDLDQVVQVDGFPSYNWTWMAAPSYGFANGNFEEITFDVSGRSAETEASGIRVNQIPREGGNTFSGRFFANGAPPDLQATNLNADLRARGVTSGNTLRRLYHVNPSLGGPIVRDRLWFFVGFTQAESSDYAANKYFNSCLTCWTYTPDLSRPAYAHQLNRDFSLRNTWQVSPRNKVATLVSINRKLDEYMFLGSIYASPSAAPEVAQAAPSRNEFYIATWQSPVTNRLLLEAGFANSPSVQPYEVHEGSTQPQIADFGYNVTYRNLAGLTLYEHQSPQMRAALNYVTGSHAIRVGGNNIWGGHTISTSSASQTAPFTSYQAFLGQPTAVVFSGAPVRRPMKLMMTSLFANDQWTMDRVTLNLALRYEQFSGDVVGSTNAATLFVPAARVTQDLEVLRWKDLSPRVGVVFDVFGNGRTALKAQAGRYVAAEGARSLTAVDPLAANNSMTRSWTDNGDFVPQGDPLNPLRNGELGPSQNLSFGQPTQTLFLDPSQARGFNVRPANWEFSGEIEQVVAPGLSVSVGYFQRAYLNQAVTENQAVRPEDYDAYCVTLPQDPRLPNAGQQLCGNYNIRSSALGLTRNVRRSAEDFGGIEQSWKGLDFTVRARPARLLLQGGVSVGYSSTDTCAVITGRPNVTPDFGDFGFASTLTRAFTATEQYCQGETPWQADGKLLATYTFPWDIQASGTYRDAAGQSYYANGQFTNAQIIPSLGRALSTGSTATIRMASVGSFFTERLRQVDARFAKTFRVGRARLQGQFDLYNLLNGNAVTLTQSAYGATAGAQAATGWNVPTTFLVPRLVKFGLQLDF